MIKADDIIDLLCDHRPKVYWECSEDMLLNLHQVKDGMGKCLLQTNAVEPANSAVASGTLLGVPIHVHRLPTTKHLTLCVEVLPGSGIERYGYRPPCDCREFKLERADCGAPTGTMICLECGKPSSDYKVTLYD